MLLLFSRFVFLFLHVSRSLPAVLSESMIRLTVPLLSLGWRCALTIASLLALPIGAGRWRQTGLARRVMTLLLPVSVLTGCGPESYRDIRPEHWTW
jgi:hypothetical protein